MTLGGIIEKWKKLNFKPVYLLHGEEDYFIDQLVDYAEHHLMNEEQASFNRTIFYGKDAEWPVVINACRRYPMFAEFQLVILKEAQSMKDFDKLMAYFEQPLSSTVFVIAYKGKSIDKRSKLAKHLIKIGEVFLSEKVKDYNLRAWVVDYLKTQGLSMNDAALQLFCDHVGNDLSRVSSEIGKLKINLKNRTAITPDDIETYIGVSKEFNVFELQSAIIHRNLAGAINIINYFEANPKAAPLQAALPALYSFVSKVYGAYGMANQSDQTLRPLFYNSNAALDQAKTMMRNYNYQGVEKIILLLNHYNLKGVGVGDSGTEHALLLKEMVVKIMLA